MKREGIESGIRKNSKKVCKRVKVGRDWEERQVEQGTGRTSVRETQRESEREERRWSRVAEKREEERICWR